ncbi:phosphonate C-P lyase system protein PhnH [Rhodobacteraceae bacterium HSP-20]|uniref:Phosphonate C-P lyase system protein PhnH n=1 Tax=Paragemmobacter amnigenus TaxID=2852097 RepID=A0ABS6JB11_9RHOB|nr:phosphonate C-P lyase system protein PhnH [Rhodobacter amnigenus]MBU9700064.1 phosphonate C-P lyase system protein PhnH [Rhodobacter amnigenus]MBV4391291.1 phosphonate C-P lyase system protein PhnH [Rhodobacter amnigenus]
MTPDTLTGGFATPPTDSARAFRAILDALARPGTIRTVDGAEPPAPLSSAAGAVALTLLDGTTPVHLAGDHDTQDLRDWLTFHTGAPLVAAAEAAFAFGTWDALLPLDRFAIGTPEYPDRAATLVIEMPNLHPEGATLRGPGIKGSAYLSLPATAPFIANRSLFPLGFDAFLTCGNRIAGLPRSTIVRDA